MLVGAKSVSSNHSSSDRFLFGKDGVAIDGKGFTKNNQSLEYTLSKEGFIYYNLDSTIVSGDYTSLSFGTDANSVNYLRIGSYKDVLSKHAKDFLSSSAWLANPSGENLTYDKAPTEDELEKGVLHGTVNYGYVGIRSYAVYGLVQAGYTSLRLDLACTDSNFDHAIVFPYGNADYKYFTNKNENGSITIEFLLKDSAEKYDDHTLTSGNIYCELRNSSETNLGSVQGNTFDVTMYNIVIS